MTPGQIAYEGYRKASGGKSLISGQPLPEWDGLTSAIQAAWEASGEAVMKAGWKPASEPPDTGRTVLACKGNDYTIGWYGTLSDGWITETYWENPTHWRELPPLPEGGDK